DADVALERVELQQCPRKRTILNNNPPRHLVRCRPDKIQTCNILIADPNAKSGHPWRCRIKIDQIGAGRNTAKLEGAIGVDRHLEKSIQPAAGNNRSHLSSHLRFRTDTAAYFSSQLSQESEVQIIRRCPGSYSY